MTIDATDSTLHLPRILCLHGGGTNARIFRMQCRVLQRTLSTCFRLVFAEGPFPAEPGPDVTSTYKDYGPFKSWLRVRPQDPALDPHHVVGEIETSLAAARLADDYRGATGEWVALMGFSQGGKLAASILMNQQELRRRVGDSVTRPVYRFAILLAARGPLVWLHPEMPMPRVFVGSDEPTMGVRSRQNMVPMQERLSIPTIHVHGLADPGLDFHRRLLYQYCDHRATSLVEWGGNHRVPIKAADVQQVVQQILFTAQRMGVIKGTAEIDGYVGRLVKAHEGSLPWKLHPMDGADRDDPSKYGFGWLNLEP